MTQELEPSGPPWEGGENLEQRWCPYCNQVIIASVNSRWIGKKTERVEIICTWCQATLELRHVTFELGR